MKGWLALFLDGTTAVSSTTLLKVEPLRRYFSRANITKTKRVHLTMDITAVLGSLCNIASLIRITSYITTSLKFYHVYGCAVSSTSSKIQSWCEVTEGYLSKQKFIKTLSLKYDSQSFRLLFWLFWTCSFNLLRHGCNTKKKFISC